MFTTSLRRPPECVALCEGGNSTQTDSRLGTFEDVLAATSPALASFARPLRALIAELHPGVVEVLRPGEPTVA